MHDVNVDNIRSQMRKGTLEFATLLVISKRSAYSSDILSALKSANLLVVEGTLYPLLTRLKDLGLLSYDWEESTGGPPRKYYSITPKGTETLKALASAWKELNSSITSLRRI